MPSSKPTKLQISHFCPLSGPKRAFFIMPPPSIQLLRAIRAVEYIQTSLPAGRQYQNNLSFHWSIGHHSRSLSHASHRIQAFTTTANRPTPSTPKSADRGPASAEESQTDFGSLNVLGGVPPPATAIDACVSDGFHLNNGLKIIGGSGCLLVGGEAFWWRPWLARHRSGTSESGRMINGKGQWDVAKEAWGLLDLLWPKPGEDGQFSKVSIPVANSEGKQTDLLILGLGPSMHPISPETRHHINSLGIRLDIQDTRNAAAQFNLLATERGVGNVAAALIPMGWKEPKI